MHFFRYTLAQPRRSIAIISICLASVDHSMEKHASPSQNTDRVGIRDHKKSVNEPSAPIESLPSQGAYSTYMATNSPTNIGNRELLLFWKCLLRCTWRCRQPVPVSTMYEYLGINKYDLMVLERRRERGRRAERGRKT